VGKALLDRGEIAVEKKQLLGLEKPLTGLHTRGEENQKEFETGGRAKNGWQENEGVLVERANNEGEEKRNTTSSGTRQLTQLIKIRPGKNEPYGATRIKIRVTNPKQIR